MTIARLTHLRLSIPLLGAPPGKVSESCFPDAETAAAQPSPRCVSFAEDTNMLSTEDDSPVLSQISPPLTQPVVEKMEQDTPTSETSSPGDGGIDVDEFVRAWGNLRQRLAKKWIRGCLTFQKNQRCRRWLCRDPLHRTLSQKQCRRWVMLVCLYRRQTMVRYQSWYGYMPSLRKRDGLYIERGWCLGGGWLVRVLLGREIGGVDSLAGSGLCIQKTPHTECRTMPNRRENMAFC